MTDPASNPDNTQDTFISHLVELRSRLMRSIIAVVVVLLCLVAWSKAIHVFTTAPVGVQMMTDIDKYLSFVLTMFIAFGITFEVPVVVIVLVRLGVVKLETLRSIRGYVVVGAFVVGAIFTPPDILSQVMLAVPLWLLFELGF